MHELAHYKGGGGVVFFIFFIDAKTIVWLHYGTTHGLNSLSITPNFFCSTFRPSLYNRLFFVDIFPQKNMYTRSRYGTWAASFRPARVKYNHWDGDEETKEQTFFRRHDFQAKPWTRSVARDQADRSINILQVKGFHDTTNSSLAICCIASSQKKESKVANLQPWIVSHFTTVRAKYIFQKVYGVARKLQHGLCRMRTAVVFPFIQARFSVNTNMLSRMPTYAPSKGKKACWTWWT